MPMYTEADPNDPSVLQGDVFSDVPVFFYDGRGPLTVKRVENEIGIHQAVLPRSFREANRTGILLCACLANVVVLTASCDLVSRDTGGSRRPMKNSHIVYAPLAPIAEWREAGFRIENQTVVNMQRAPDTGPDWCFYFPTLPNGEPEALLNMQILCTVQIVNGEGRPCTNPLDRNPLVTMGRERRIARLDAEYRGVFAAKVGNYLGRPGAPDLG